MTSEGALKNVRIVVFPGTAKEYYEWSKRFLCMAELKECKDELIGTGATRDDSENSKAHNDLTLSCEDDVSFGTVDEAASVAHPNGDAREAWKKLKEHYDPSTGSEIVDLKQDFNDCSLDEDQDPAVWIT